MFHPSRVLDGSGWAKIELGANHTCGIKLDGSLWCWGDNEFGQLGDGSRVHRSQPVMIGNEGDKWIEISLGGKHTCGIKLDGSLWCWGDNEFGQLGNGSNISHWQPEQIGNENDWSVLDAGQYHNCAYKSNGSLWCWGRNDNGQVGDESLINRLVPVRIGN